MTNSDDEVNSPIKKQHKRLERGAMSEFCTPMRHRVHTRLSFDSDMANRDREATLNRNDCQQSNKRKELEILDPVPRFQKRSLEESDMRFMLEKRKREEANKKQQNQEKETNETDDQLKKELEKLRNQQQLLKEKIAAQKEILRMEEELKGLQQAQAVSSEYQTVGSETSNIKKRDTRRSPKRDTAKPKKKVSKELEKLKEEMDQMKQFVAKQKGMPVPENEPLIESIEKAPVNHSLRVPQLDPFDGTTDPGDYLEMFNGRMNFYGHNDIHKCQLFPTCLQGSARKWYRKLKPISIDSWHALAEQFKMRWSSNLEDGKESCSLMQVRQRRTESLREYITRFRQECAEIPYLVEDVAINSLGHGIDQDRHSNIIEEYLEKRPRSLREAFQILEHRLNIQEAAGSIRPRWTQRGTEKTEKGDQKKEEPRKEWRNSEPRDRPRFKPDDEYTRLNTSRVQILEYLQKDPTYQIARPMNPDRKINTSKYCDHHKDFGHETERCNQLRELIERKIKSGELQQFVDKAQHIANIESSSEYRNIGAIFGGHAGGGFTKNSRKSYARQVHTVDIRPIKKARSSMTISFSSDDYHTDLLEPHDDALVITALVGKNKVQKMLIDNGSSIDVLFLHAYDRMDLTGHKIDLNNDCTLYAFNGQPVNSSGTIELPVIFGHLPHQTTKSITFYVVDLPSMYNAILGRTTLVLLGAITSIPHLKMKFPTETGVGEIRGDQTIARTCYMTTLQANDKGKALCHNIQLEVENFGQETDKEKSIQAASTIQEIIVDDKWPDKKFMIAANLETTAKQALTTLLSEFIDIFAWSPQEMPGIPKSLAVHKLGVRKEEKPIRQKRRFCSLEKQKAIEEEVEKLLAAKFIKEIRFPEWVANVVMVKKSNGKWRMCTDYTDLNKACRKDFYPLPNIDQLIDSVAGSTTLSFLDAFSGYNQIKMAEEDIPKTAFITHKGVFAYTVMPFGHINAGATFQRTMDKIFAQQKSKQLEVYVDDIIVKSKPGESHVDGVREVFKVVRATQMRLNPLKCTFGVESGKFLGFIISERGIEADPKQVSAIINMNTPQTPRAMKVLTGCLAALRRFIPKVAEKFLPFFDTLKQAKKYSWNNECNIAFENLKIFLTTPPVLTSPHGATTLYLYIAASEKAVAAVLTRKIDTTMHPIYYVSQVLRQAEENYSKMEKVAFAVVMASRKLRQYFQGFQIEVLTDKPIRQILHRPDISGRLAAWALELSQYELLFKPRGTIQAHNLADFLIECTFETEIEKPKITDPSSSKSAPETRFWLLFIDGSSTTQGGGVGILLESPEGFKIKQAIKLSFQVTNNEAEYEAIIAGLQLAMKLEVHHIKVFTDSQLVANQVNGLYKATQDNMIQYLQVVLSLITHFTSISVTNIDRSQNIAADMLSKFEVTDNRPMHESVYIDELFRPFILSSNNVLMTQEENDWRTPIRKYILNGELPNNAQEARKLKAQAHKYCLIEDKLYKRAFMSPLLLCIGPDEAKYSMKEVHSGICGEHLGGKNLAFKLLRQGYYWNTMKKDCLEYVKKCEACQRCANNIHVPSNELMSILNPVPFSMWGIDIVGPLPKARGNLEFLIVAVDYTIKWVEARATVRIREIEVIHFIMEMIIFRFGIPRVIVSDNGKQFIGSEVEATLDELQIKHAKSSVAYPQSNGQVEVSNRTILGGLIRRVWESKTKWVEELPNVLWAYRTTPRSATGVTPFKMAYGTEALIPFKLGVKSLRVEKFVHETNEVGIKMNLDLLDEERDAANLRMAQYQKKTAQYYNKRVKSRTLEAGDLVLREKQASGAKDQGKLCPIWEGPFKIVQVLKPGTYILANMDDSPIPNTWNIAHLKRFYQ